MAAPALAASIAAAAISSPVTGKWGDMLGVWIAPVGAQVMIALDRVAMADFLGEELKVGFGVRAE